MIYNLKKMTARNVNFCNLYVLYFVKHIIDINIKINAIIRKKIETFSKNVLSLVKTIDIYN